jgi:hypothetical protein
VLTPAIGEIKKRGAKSQGHQGTEAARNEAVDQKLLEHIVRNSYQQIRLKSITWCMALKSLASQVIRYAPILLAVIAINTSK